MRKQAVNMLNELAKSGCEKAVNEKIQDLILNGKDFDLYKINAFRIAQELKIDRATALRGFLFATRIGLFDLNWDIYCPSCRGLPEYYRHMMGLKKRAHCLLCEIDWDMDFEKQVEVTFTANPGVRKIRYKDFHQRDFRGMMGFIKETQAREGREFTLGDCIFADREVDIPATFSPGRYLYWVTEPKFSPSVLEVTRKRSRNLQIVELAVDRWGKIQPGCMKR